MATLKCVLKRNERGPRYTVLTDTIPEKEKLTIYTYEDLSDDVLRGYEVMFTYNGFEYSITHSVEGRYFTKVIDYENATLYSTPEELLSEVRIGIETLQQVFDSGNVSDVSV